MLLAISLRSGTRRAGTIAIDHDGVRYGYRFRSWKDGGVRMLNVEPAGGAFAVSPRLASMLSDIAVLAAEAHDDEQRWEVESGIDGWTVRAATERAA